MNWREMPPLPALRAFAAFAENGNVTDAGAALNVSHAAISQQLRALERVMGVALLDRSGRTLELTPEGRRLADALQLGFGTIHSTVQDLTGATAARPLYLSVTPTLAANWLMPRLADFRAAHPTIDITLDPTPEVVALEPGGIDIALRYGVGPWPGLDAEMFLFSPIVLVAAPGLLEGRTLKDPSDLAALPWLEELGTSEGSNWLRRQGVVGGITGGSVTLPGNLVLDGARDGQGIAVSVRAFVEADVAAGRLKILHQEEAGAGYQIVTRPGVLRPPAKAFVQWLRRQKDASD